MFSLLTGIILLSWTDILDTIQSNNVTYGRHAKAILCKHYAINEKYFYIIELYFTAVIIGPFATVAIGTMILSYVIHTCGLFRIARLENSLNPLACYECFI